MQCGQTNINGAAYMRIIVCVKQVPGTSNVEINSETGVMKRDSTRGKLNPFDLFALEQALMIKDRVGGYVATLSMGPMQAETSLKETLYIGADEAYLLCDRALIGSDVLATSRAISGAVKYIGGADVILCGKQTTDGDTAQVGPEVAEMLGIGHVSNVIRFDEIREKELTLTAALEKTEYTCRVRTPTLISVEKDINTPRLPSYKRMKIMKDHEVTLIRVSELEDNDPTHYGISGSATSVVRMFAPEKQKNHRFLETDSKTAAEAFMTAMKERKLI